MPAIQGNPADPSTVAQVNARLAGTETPEVVPLAAGGNKPLPPKIYPPNQPIVEALWTGYIIENNPRGGT
jgi:hypothetical protein